MSLLSTRRPRPREDGGERRPQGYGTLGAAAGTQVSVEGRVPGAWERVAVAETAADGSFAAASPPLSARTAFRAVAGGALSPSVRAEVRPHLHVARSGRRLRVMVEPTGAGGRAVLAGLNLNTYRWRTVARRTLRAGAAAFRLGPPGVYRVTASPGQGLSDATSPPLQFRPVRFHR